MSFLRPRRTRGTLAPGKPSAQTGSSPSPTPQQLGQEGWCVQIPRGDSHTALHGPAAPRAAGSLQSSRRDSSHSFQRLKSSGQWQL